jgi:phage gp46-like protein
MVDIIIRPDPACPENGLYGWDTVYNNDLGLADWAFAGADEPSNKGGLANRAALATAVTIGLFTDRACPSDHPLVRFADGDLRGWWGDGVLETGEQPLGSLLWLLERSIATEETRRWAEVFAIEALDPLVKSGACAKVVATATILPDGNGLMLDIGLYGRDGTRQFDQKYELAWRQIMPNAFGGGM